MYMKCIQNVVVFIILYFLQDAFFEVAYYFCERQNNKQLENTPSDYFKYTYIYPLHTFSHGREVNIFDIVTSIIRGILCLFAILVATILFKYPLEYLIKNIYVLFFSVVITHIMFFKLHGCDPGEAEEAFLACMYRNVSISIIVSIIVGILITFNWGISDTLKISVGSITIGFLRFLVYI